MRLGWGSGSFLLGPRGEDSTLFAPELGPDRVTPEHVLFEFRRAAALEYATRTGKGKAHKDKGRAPVKKRGLEIEAPKRLVIVCLGPAVVVVNHRLHVLALPRNRANS